MSEEPDFFFSHRPLLLQSHTSLFSCAPLLEPLALSVYCEGTFLDLVSPEEIEGVGGLASGLCSMGSHRVNRSELG